MAMVKYLRQSAGNKTSIRQQDEIGDERAVELGEVVYETFRDYTAAGRFAKKQREDWDNLLAVLHKPEVTLVWLWEPSRGSRELEDWAGFLNRCRENSVKILVETHDQVYDMDNDRHWKTMAEEGIASQDESLKASKRVKRNVKDAIKRGRPHGQPNYGYRREYAEVDGKPKLVRQFAEETEAPVVRELWRRADEGESVLSIQRDYLARGIRTRVRKHRKTGELYGGEPFTYQGLRKMLLTPGYAGIRTHRPEDCTEEGLGGRGTLSAGTTVHDTDPVVWEPLVSKEQYYRVQATLTTRGRLGRPGRGWHLSSWKVLCGVCGGHLGARQHHGEWTYFCLAGCVTCQKDELDSALNQAVLSYLAWRGIAKEGPAQQAAAPDSVLAGIQGKLEEKRALQRSSGAAYAAGQLSVGAFVQADGDLKAAITGLEVQQREISGMTRLDAMLGDPAEDISVRWGGLPISAKRRMLGILFTPEHMGQPYLMHQPRGSKPGTVPVAERLEWKGADEKYAEYDAARAREQDEILAGDDLFRQRVLRWANASDYRFRDFLTVLGWAADPVTHWTPRISKDGLAARSRELGRPVPLGTIRHRLADLEKLGVITVDRDWHVTGGRRGRVANAYRIDFTKTIADGLAVDGYDFEE